MSGAGNHLSSTMMSGLPSLLDSKSEQENEDVKFYVEGLDQWICTLPNLKF